MLLTVTQAHFPCKDVGNQEDWQANWRQSQLTIPTNSVVSVPRVSFRLSGWACLACCFLFSPWCTISMPGCSSSATCRFGRGRQSGTLLLFSLSISRSRFIRAGQRFSTPLWADQRKQERKVCSLQLKRRNEGPIKDTRKETHKWACKERKTEKGETPSDCKRQCLIY